MSKRFPTLLFLLATLMAFAGHVQAQTETLDRVVAVVDDDVIMASELGLRMQVMASQLRQTGREVPDEDFMRRQVLERLIVESLQVQLGERAGAKVTDEQIDQAVAKVAAQNQMDVRTFANKLAQEGVPFSMFRESMRREIIIQQVQQTIVTRRIDISEQDIDNFLASEEGRYLAQQAAAREPVTQAHVRHILVKTTAIRNDDEVKALLTQVKKQVEDGKDFALYARRFSEDPGSALKGGDLDWISPGQMVPEFEQVVAGTPVGEVSPPFQTQYGWHILQVLEMRQQDMSEQVLRQQASIILRKRQYQDELPRWLKELRDKAYVQIKL